MNARQASHFDFIFFTRLINSVHMLDPLIYTSHQAVQMLGYKSKEA